LWLSPPPKIIVLALESLLIISLAVAHVERIGHDPRAGFQLCLSVPPYFKAGEVRRARQTKMSAIAAVSIYD
jgi:hypothetical protein